VKEGTYSLFSVGVRKDVCFLQFVQFVEYAKAYRGVLGELDALQKKTFSHVSERTIEILQHNQSAPVPVNSRT